ncbi:MAG: shikimate dehydrogenase [Candidatus Omnitrophica bacterium]|nr:shikimate dehydrogenase [Candidatus Omnitrophota bacterium]MDD5487629.1 shikimate dehydrogenase [Candidatus Omnitrophota bacterium]
MDNDNGNGNGNGKMIYGLLGRKISYSLSPVMHNAAFRHFNIPAEYRIFDVEKSDLEVFYQDVISPTGNIKGFNVTVPYKMDFKEMIQMFSKHPEPLHEWAAVTGAVNTVKVEGDKLRGFNTDVQGFYDAISDIPDFDPVSARKIFIAGTGGAGRAICLFLAHMVLPSRIYVYDVVKERVESLAEDFGRYLGHMERMSEVFSGITSAGDVPSRIVECDLVINATPLGTKEGDRCPLPVDDIRDGAVVYDLVYARQTELVSRARARGLRAYNGESMLSNQAALSFNIWTDGDDDDLILTKKIMKDALMKELGRS